MGRTQRVTVWVRSAKMSGVLGVLDAGTPGTPDVLGTGVPGRLPGVGAG
ncbi:hypothetical protein GCM10017771_05820 [Streptomyces capitiformicae]|uniref:Uncharacterized protein n=1 Tax=Streptomyces capitiformicae TaxID=2014920 RepID=A0A919GCH3_9ACTN|nr:hypothetical protein GCM10017771_05820 [Streptomyces capitiformicae]